MKRTVKMMALLIAAIAMVLNASALAAEEVIIEVNVTAGGFETAVTQALTSNYPGKTIADITALTVSGTMNATDFNPLKVATNYTSLKILDLGNVSYSGNIPFWECPELIDLTLPANVGALNPTWAFNDLPKLEAIHIAENANNYKTVDGVLFSKSGKTLVRYPRSKRDLYYTAPAGVDTMGIYSVQSTTYLAAIRIQEGLKFCDQQTFSSGLALKSVTLPASLEKVSYGLARNNKVIDQLIMQKETPVYIVNNQSSNELAWDNKSTFKLGVVDQTAVTAWSTSDTENYNWKAYFASRTVIYAPVTVENAESPYPFAVGGIQVPVIAEPVKEGLDFAGWTTTSGVIFGDATSLVTYFTMPATVVPVTVTANYVAGLHSVAMVNGTITAGAFNGKGAAGAQVSIKANLLKGQRFLHWEADGDDIVFGNSTEIETGFTMPDRDVTITAVSETLEGVIIEVNITAGNLASAVETALANEYPGKTIADIIALTVNGAMNSADFNALTVATNYTSLKILDLNNASYSGNLPTLRCPELIDFTLPANLGGITDKWAFNALPKLEAFHISGNAINYKTLDGVLFSKDGKKLVRYPISKRDLYYTAPAGVETMGYYSVHGTTYLVAIRIQEGLTFCDEWVFTEGKALKSVTLPASLERVSYGLVRSDNGVFVIQQLIMQNPVPVYIVNNWGSNELAWNTPSSFRLGVVDNNAVTAWSTSDATNYNWKQFFATKTVVYAPVTVENAMSPYPFAIGNIQVPVIAEPVKDGLNFSGWTTTSGVIFGNTSNPVTYFTMPATAVPVTVTANYESGPGMGYSKLTFDPEKAIDVRFYNLQGIEIKTPAGNELYIVKRTFESNRTEVTKEIYIQK